MVGNAHPTLNVICMGVIALDKKVVVQVKFMFCGQCPNFKCYTQNCGFGAKGSSNAAY